MKKQLPTDGIANELADASVFFQKRSIVPEPKPQAYAEPANPQQTSQWVDDVKAENQIQQEPVTTVTPQHPQPDRMTTSNHVTTPPNNQAKSLVNNQAAMPPGNHALMPPLMLEQIRKVVRQVGKEAATYRLTQAEKQQLADIVYTYKRRGYRTSDNELARIAINWLVLDYQEQGEQSVLACVLESLHR